jgi:hypothetical protein
VLVELCRRNFSRDTNVISVEGRGREGCKDEAGELGAFDWVDTFFASAPAVLGGCGGDRDELSSSWIKAVFSFLGFIVEPRLDWLLKVEDFGSGVGTPFRDGVVVDFCTAEDLGGCFSTAVIDSSERSFDVSFAASCERQRLMRVAGIP